MGSGSSSGVEMRPSVCSGATARAWRRSNKNLGKKLCWHRCSDGKQPLCIHSRRAGSAGPVAGVLAGRDLTRRSAAASLYVDSSTHLQLSGSDRASVSPPPRSAARRRASACGTKGSWRVLALSLLPTDTRTTGQAADIACRDSLEADGLPLACACWPRTRVQKCPRRETGGARTTKTHRRGRDVLLEVVRSCSALAMLWPAHTPSAGSGTT